MYLRLRYEELGRFDGVTEWMRSKVHDADISVAAIGVDVTGIHAVALVEIEAYAYSVIWTSDDFAGPHGAIAFWHRSFAVHFRPAVRIYLAGVTDNSLAPCSKK